MRFGTSNEEHAAPGGWQKDVTNSGLDGLITGSIILAGGLGAGVDHSQAKALSLGIVFIQGVALAVGEFLSARSYSRYVRQEFEREKWEMENYPEGEISEMIHLFANRGMHLKDATAAISIMAKYRPFFVNLMMTEELSLPLPDDVQPSVMQSTLMLTGFVAFGSLPIAFLAMSQTLSKSPLALTLSLISVALAVLGSMKAKFAGGGERYALAGVETLLLGVLSALASGLSCQGLAYLAAQW